MLRSLFCMTSACCLAPSSWIYLFYKHSAQTPRKILSLFFMTSPRCIARSDTRIICLPSRCLETYYITLLFYCCVRVLHSNGCFCGSAVLVWSKYAALYIYIYIYMCVCMYQFQCNFYLWLLYTSHLITTSTMLLVKYRNWIRRGRGLFEALSKHCMDRLGATRPTL
jgi:hypothetical protein